MGGDFLSPKGAKIGWQATKKVKEPKTSAQAKNLSRLVFKVITVPKASYFPL
jgi:hypothetical protein